MSNRFCRWTFVILTICFSGCAMCSNPFDCQYGAYGSRLPRADMTFGRVGSILDGAQGGVVTTEVLGPVEGSEPYYDQSYSEGEIIYGEPTPIEGLSNETYSPPSFEQLPATEQIERVYETIEGEIGTGP